MMPLYDVRHLQREHTRSSSKENGRLQQGLGAYRCSGATTSTISLELAATAVSALVSLELAATAASEVVMNHRGRPNDASAALSSGQS